MNHTYRVVWNNTLGVWHAVTEHARGRGKCKSRRLLALALAGAVLAMPSYAEAQALPTGGTITAGTGSLHETADHLAINQSSDKLAIDWQSFSIGQGQTVTFYQPSAAAVALNRVLGTDVSVIQGALNANGQVFLINPNGVLFSPTAQVNAGSLVASTLELSKDDFLADRYRLSGASTNAVVNQGNITAAHGGLVALIAAKIENTGSISAPQGDVLLGAGNTVTLDLGGPVKLQVEAGAVNALIESGGAIRADGGTILMAAKAAEDIASTVINHTGILEAKAVVAGEDGSITLLGEHGTVAVAGTVDVSATAGAAGKAVVTGERVVLADDARVDASGAQGGEIYIGGGWQGQDPAIKNAQTTTVAAGATLDASGVGDGDGGTVAVWADEETRYSGDITATGGEGGRVEVSGKQTLSFAGAVNTGGGLLLLDPTTITVQSTTGDLSNTFSGAQIRSLLGDNDVTLTADEGITWNSDAKLDYDGLVTGRTLTLNAGTNIVMGNDGMISDGNGTDDALSVVLDAGGAITVNGTVHSGQGGNISVNARGGAISMQGGYITAGGTGNLDVQSSSALTMNASTLNVEDGNLTGDIAGNYGTLWGASFNSTGAGDINLTSRTGSINVGTSNPQYPTSIGIISSTGTGNITLRANALNAGVGAGNSIRGNGELLILPYGPDSSIGIGDGANGTLALSAWTVSRLEDGFSQITIGHANGSGAIDVRTAAFKDNLVIRAPSAGGSIGVNGTLSTTGDTIILESAGGISQSNSGAIQASQALLLGTGDFNLSAGSNSIGTLAADVTGSLAFHDTDALTIGSVGTKNGIAATGTIDVATRAADLTVSQAITSTDASDSAIVLNAGRNTAAGTSTGGNVILNSTLTAGNGGRVSIYTGSIVDSTGVATAAGGSGSGRYRYGSDEASTNYTAALGTGTYVIYRERPSLSVTPSNAQGQYGGTPDLSGVTYTLAGYQNGDLGGESGTASYTTTAGATSNAGTYNIAYSSGLSHNLGYAFSDDGNGGEYTVTQRILNLSGSRAYDGTNDVAAAIFSLGNLANGDTLNLSGSGLIADRHVGNNKTVTLGTLALANGADGDLASNYTLTDGTHVANVTQATVTLTGGFTVSDKTYDNSITATIADASGLQLSGLATGEDLDLNGLAAAFAGKDAAHAKTVSLTAANLSNGNLGMASDYQLDMTGAPTTTADIMRRPVTVTAHNLEKQLGATDPALSYTTEAQAAGRGLINGEALNGALVRQSGDGMGRYVISQGTLNNAGNPNYQVDFVEGALTINPSPEVTAAQHAAKVLPDSVVPTQTAMASVEVQDIDVELQFSSLSRGEEASTPGSSEENGSQTNALSGAAQPAGPLTVFVVEGGVRYPHLSQQ